MLRFTSITIMIGIAILLFVGCESKSTSSAKQDATPEAAAPAHGSDDGHTHAPGEKCTDHTEAVHDQGETTADDHEGHDHGEAGHDQDEAEREGHGHGGGRHELGSREIAGLTLKVAQFGVVADNIDELVFEINAQGEPAPIAVRLLVRTPDGSESLKIKANKVGDHDFDAHVGELPREIAEGSVVVIEVETAAGAEELTFPLKR